MASLPSASSFTVIIPARLASTRLPNKPLADIAGIPMVVRVAQRVQSGVNGVRVVVAADHPSILQACKLYGVEALLTAQDHPSGSDRLAQACELLSLEDDGIVVNVQGDEPLIDTSLVKSVAGLLESNTTFSIGTAAHPIDSVEDFVNPNVVKVVTDAQSIALYFSRAPIAWWRDGFMSGIQTLPAQRPLRHIGIYAYRVGFLKLFPKLAISPIEVTEALEQLRAMWHGYRIAVHLSPTAPGPGVDTPEDLARVRKYFELAATSV
jgi:3-deoxy-manno-octulosonate cytidylyltransferase (CMP-KDO synthetase)